MSFTCLMSSYKNGGEKAVGFVRLVLYRYYLLELKKASMHPYIPHSGSLVH